MWHAGETTTRGTTPDSYRLKSFSNAKQFVSHIIMSGDGNGCDFGDFKNFKNLALFIISWTYHLFLLNSKKLFLIENSNKNNSPYL